MLSKPYTKFATVALDKQAGTILLLQSECDHFHSSLEDLRQDVVHRKELQREYGKHFRHPHPIGVTEPELRAAAGEHNAHLHQTCHTI